MNDPNHFPQYDHDGKKVSICESAVSDGWLISRCGSSEYGREFLRWDNCWDRWLDKDTSGMYTYDSLWEAKDQLERLLGVIEQPEWDDHES